MPFCSFFPGKQLLAMQLYMVCCEPSSSLSHTPQCVRKCFRHEYRRSPLNIVIVGLYLAATMFTGWNISPLLGNQQRVTNTLTKAIGARKFTRGANKFQSSRAPSGAERAQSSYLSPEFDNWMVAKRGRCMRTIICATESGNSAIGDQLAGAFSITNAQYVNALRQHAVVPSAATSHCLCRNMI